MINQQPQTRDEMIRYVCEINGGDCTCIRENIPPCLVQAALADDVLLWIAEAKEANTAKAAKAAKAEQDGKAMSTTAKWISVAGELILPGTCISITFDRTGVGFPFILMCPDRISKNFSTLDLAKCVGELWAREAAEFSGSANDRC